MTISKKIREQLGLRPSQELEFETRDGLLIGRKRMSGDPVSSVTAILNPLDVDPLKRVGDPSGARNSMRTAVDSSILLDIQSMQMLC